MQQTSLRLRCGGACLLVDEIELLNPWRAQLRRQPWWLVWMEPAQSCAAGRRSNLGAVRMLIEHNADPRPARRHARADASVACYNDEAARVHRALIEAGARLNAIDWTASRRSCIVLLGRQMKGCRNVQSAHREGRGTDNTRRMASWLRSRVRSRRATRASSRCCGTVAAPPPSHSRSCCRRSCCRRRGAIRALDLVDRQRRRRTEAARWKAGRNQEFQGR